MKQRGKFLFIARNELLSLDVKAIRKYIAEHHLNEGAVVIRFLNGNQNAIFQFLNLLGFDFEKKPKLRNEHFKKTALIIRKFDDPWEGRNAFNFLLGQLLGEGVFLWVNGRKVS